MHIGCLYGNNLVDTAVDLTDLGIGSVIFGPNTLIDGTLPQYVFDNNGGATTCRMALSPVLRDCRFGWDFGPGQERWTHGFSVLQYNNPYRGITSVIYEYTHDLVTWYPIGTFTLGMSDQFQVIETPRARGRAFQLVANANNANGYWEPFEFQLLETVVQ